MKFKNLYVSELPIVSFELFPPKTEEGLDRLEERLPKLISLDPAFISVTYGALGSTQDLTLELTSKIKNVYGHEAVQHLTCVGSPQAEIEKMQRYALCNLTGARRSTKYESILLCLGITKMETRVHQLKIYWYNKPFYRY